MGLPDRVVVLLGVWLLGAGVGFRDLKGILGLVWMAVSLDRRELARRERRLT